MTDMSSSQSGQKPPKKSELLEVRLDHESKQSFLTACRKAGRTASDVVREQIARWVAEQEPGKAGVLAVVPKRLRKKRFVAIAAGFLGLTTFVALPSAAGPDFRAKFDQIDINGDGVITLEEYIAPSQRMGVDVDVTTPLPADAGELPPAGQMFDAAWVAGLPAARRTGLVLQRALAQEDFDKDGRIDFDEYREAKAASAAGGFGMLDFDDDDWISLEEFLDQGRPAVFVKRWAEKDAVTLPPGFKLNYGTPEIDAKLRKDFAGADADRNGRLGLDEYMNWRL